MKVKKKHGLFGVLVPCNADINVKFSKRYDSLNISEHFVNTMVVNELLFPSKVETHCLQEYAFKKTGY